MTFFERIEKYFTTILENLDAEINDIMQQESNLAEKEAQQTIIKYDRIDTGLMLRTVRSETTFYKYKKTFSLISDQEQRGVYYSSFQEFGTKNGIKGIYFVNNSFDNAVDRIMEKLKEIEA